MRVVYAVTTASLSMPSGESFIVRAGTHWPEDDPIVVSHPGVFSPDARYGLSYSGEPPAEMAEPPVEQATAAPGERRNTRRNA